MDRSAFVFLRPSFCLGGLNPIKKVLDTLRRSLCTLDEVVFCSMLEKRLRDVHILLGDQAALLPGVLIFFLSFLLWLAPFRLNPEVRQLQGLLGLFLLHSAWFRGYGVCRPQGILSQFCKSCLVLGKINQFHVSCQISLYFKQLVPARHNFACNVL